MMTLDLSDKRVRRFRSQLYVTACCVAVMILLEFSLRIFWPQHSRAISQDGKVLTQLMQDASAIQKTNVRWKVEMPEYQVEYFLNAEGFRDQASHLVPKPMGIARFLLLGDSFVYGAGNAYDDSFPVVLERLFQESNFDGDVVKAGQLVSDTTNDVRRLPELIEQYHPDVVLLFIHANDLLTNSVFKERNCQEKPKGDKIEIALPEKREIHGLVLFKRLLRLNDWFLVKWELKRGWGKLYNREGAFRKQAVTVTQDLIRRAKKYCESRGIRFMVLSLPQSSAVIAKARNYQFPGISIDCNESDLIKFSGQEGIYFYSFLDPMAEQYRKDQKSLFYRLDGHLNREGNKFVAQRLFEILSVN